MRGRESVLLTVIALTTCALLVVALTTGCDQGPGPGSPGSPPENPAGTVWKQVRTGGGLESPAGTTGEGLRSIAWGGGRSVAVGGGGTIVHSTDGVTWTAASATATEERLSGCHLGWRPLCGRIVQRRNRAQL